MAQRIARVTARHQDAALEAELHRLAAHLDLPVAELRAEAAAVDRLCREARAFTVESRVAAVARDLGMPAIELRAEIDRLRRAADATA